jgi:hypothetical protein
MKKKEKIKSSKKTKGKQKDETKKIKMKKGIKNRNIKRHNSKVTRKNKKKGSIRKHNKKVMKGGAIPFSELNPSSLLDHTMYGVKGMIGPLFLDDTQPVPNNLPHLVNPSVMYQPYLDGKIGESLNVAGESPDVHFASS